MQLKATRNLWYDGKSYFPGDTFEASDKDAFILKGIKKAVDADEGYYTTSLEHTGVKEKRRKRRQYKRRDMSAE